MGRKLITFSLLLAITIIAWFASLTYAGVAERIAYSLLALTLIYLVFKIILEEIVSRQLDEPRTRFSFKRIVSILYIVAFIIAGIAIWVEETQSLVVAYGLVAAGIAIGLQDFFRNVVGGITLFVSHVYRIGDRIEIHDKHGDVIDIGLQYTTLLEILEWIAGDQPTGRLVLVPNGYVLSHPVHNYTKDHEFIWDELAIPVTYESDWKRAVDVIMQLVEKETDEVTDQAKQSIVELEDKYYLPRRAEVPSVYVTLTDNWIMINVRFVTRVRRRREVRTRLNALVLEAVEQAGNISIASETFDVSVKGPGEADDGGSKKRGRPGRASP